MNLFGKLFQSSEPEELSEEELKASRIQYHRDHVRNGPRQMTYWTAGQQRRRAERAQKTYERKLNKRRRADWMVKNRRLATLRGQLVVVGALPAQGIPKFSAELYQNTLAELVESYGERHATTGEVVSTDGEAIANALRTYEAVTA